MRDFIVLNIIGDSTDVVSKQYINTRYITKIYMRENKVHVELSNNTNLKLEDENIDIFMDRFYITK
tara:strand:- start:609 stop:806 length:198 start_codon:yes stop_codon:yes gene_type:complete